MRARRFSGRRPIGLLAAYLVALQALLLPLSMLPAPAVAASLCLTDSSGSPAPHPAGQDRGCPCCAGCGTQCHVPMLAGGAPAAGSEPQVWLAAVLAPTLVAAVPRPAAHSAQMPRAPPAA
jgi:hypothetical protein